MSRKIKKNYDYYGYEFIQDIMEDESIKLSERDKFYELVASLYIHDKKYRDENHGNYIIFSKGYMIAIVKTQEYARNYPIKYSKLIYYLGDDDKRIKQY